MCRKDLERAFLAAWLEYETHDTWPLRRAMLAAKRALTRHSCDECQEVSETTQKECTSPELGEPQKGTLYVDGCEGVRWWAQPGDSSASPASTVSRSGSKAGGGPSNTSRQKPRGAAKPLIVGGVSDADPHFAKSHLVVTYGHSLEQGEGRA